VKYEACTYTKGRRSFRVPVFLLTKDTADFTVCSRMMQDSTLVYHMEKVVAW